MRGGLSAKISSEFIDNLKQAMGIQSTQKQKVRFQIVEADVREFPLRCPDAQICWNVFWGR